MTYQYEIDEDDEQFDSMIGLLHVFCDEFAEDIKELAYDFMKAEFEAGQISSTYKKIKKFPSKRNCVVSFKSYGGAFLHMNIKSGDYIYVEFTKEEIIKFIRTAVNKGE